MSFGDEREIDLSEKFPDLQPIQSLPTLGSLFIIGLDLFGARDHDQETGTFVKTHCLHVLGLPMFAVGAYRLAAANNSFYIIGKQPLSMFAKAWNALLLCGILAGVGLGYWQHHTQSPEYIAAQKIAEADALAEAGDVVTAAKLYREVAFGSTSHVSEAQTKFQSLIEDLNQQPPPKAAEVLQVACERNPESKILIEDAKLLELGINLADGFAANDPAGALAVLDALAPLVAETPDDNPLTPKRLALLETIVEEQPNNVEALSQMAAIHESQGELEKCQTLLEPHRDRLGQLEGARILGQIYSRQGQHEQAVALLKPYATGRLEKLHAAEKAFTESFEQLQERIIQEVNNNEAPEWLYARARNANQAKQQEILWDYIQSQMKNDPEIFQKREALRRETPVVPVALDLGISLLERAQGLEDADARRSELEQAEQVFLSIQGVAGESNEYKLSLGQVYYWLGKHKEGQELFEQVLDANDRSFELLLSVGRTLRELGLFADARKHLEEAYGKASKPEEKYYAAQLRGITSIDNDDSILWLGRANPSDPSVRAELYSAQANKAIQEGKDEEAKTHLLKTIEIYKDQPENAATLNNAALAYFALYQLNGDPAALANGTQRVEKALTLNPSASILLNNAARAILEGAVRNIVGDAIDFNLMKSSASISSLAYLHTTPANRDRYMELVRKDAGIAKAMSYLERTLVLAPKRADAYSTLANIHEYTQNSQALKDLLRRIEDADPDLSDDLKRVQDYYSGVDDDKTRPQVDASIARYEAMLPTLDQASPPTQAMVKSNLISQLTLAHIFGREMDANRLVALAEEAHQVAPSSRTLSTLIGALCFRATETLRRAEPQYEEMYAKAKRSLGHTYLLPIALAQGGRLQEAVKANKDMQRLADLMVEMLETFPAESNPWQWAVLKDFHPEAAEQVAEIVRKDEVMLTNQKIDLKLTPTSAAEAYYSAWLYEILGQEETAREILRRCAEAQVPLPIDPE